MNVLFIGHEKNLNGASISMLDIIREMKKNNKIYVLIPYAEGPVYDVLVKEGVEIICSTYYLWCDTRSTKKNWFKKRFYWYLYEAVTNIITAKKISNYVIREKIDVIHTNTSVINIGGLISKYTGKKHIWHIREFADLDFNMYPLMNSSRYYKFMNRYADKFICVSEAVSEHYDKLNDDKKVVVHDGIDESYGMVKHDEHGDVVYMVVTGRICEAKGQKIVLEACEKLIESEVDNFKLYLAGAEKEELLITDKMGNYIEKCGYIDDMTEFRRRMDIEIVSSKSEAFGRGTAEAMAGGIPVIGRNTGGTKELISHGENGMLFNDVDELLMCMKKLIGDRELRNKLGANARVYAKEEFDIKHCVDKILNVYES